MEKQKMNVATLVIVIAIVLIVGVIAGVLIGKNMNQVQTSKKSETNATTTQTSDEKFKSYISNYKKTRSEYKFRVPTDPREELSYGKTEYNPSTGMNVDLDQDGNLYLYINPSVDITNIDENNVGMKEFYEEFNKKYNKRYKVATDVIDVVNYNYVQGTYGSFAYVKSDGTVYELSILAGSTEYTERKENIETNKKENLKNIISLQNGYCGISAIAIDIDGNMHKF